MNTNELQIESITVIASVESYLTKLQMASDKDFQENYPNTWARGGQPKFSFKRGPKWIKIIRGESLFCFIDPSNGDIYKAASYNTTAKGKRGNIFDEKVPLQEGQLYR
jgi:hypothetical protein